MIIPNQSTPLAGHVIILGLGNVGFRVFELLRRLGVAVAVVELSPDPERVALVEEAGCLFVAGDARNPEVMRRCGAASAKALLALTDQELVNLSVAIDTRQVNPDAKIIVRMFDQELAKHIQKVFAIQNVLSTTAIAAPLFTAAIYDDDDLAFFQAHGASCAIAHWHVDSASLFIGEPISRFAESENCQPLLLQRQGRLTRDFKLDDPFLAGDRILGMRMEAKAAPKPAERFRMKNWPRAVREFFGHMPKVAKVLLLTLTGLLLSGIPLFHYQLEISWMDAWYFTVTTLTTTGYGDISLVKAEDWVKAFGTLYMFAGAALLASLVGIVTDYMVSVRIREWLGLSGAPLQNHVILVGVGGLGVRIAEELQERGRAIAVCGAGPADDRFASAVRGSALLVEGDPRNHEVLAKAGVANAVAIMPITDDDVLNLSVGLLAKQMNPEIRAIVRVFDGYLAEKLKDHLHIDKVYSISATAAPSFAAALYDPSLTVGFVWGDYLAWVSHSREMPEDGAIHYVARFPLPGIADDAGSLSIKLMTLAGAAGGIGF